MVEVKAPPRLRWRNLERVAGFGLRSDWGQLLAGKEESRDRHRHGASPAKARCKETRTKLNDLSGFGLRREWQTVNLKLPSHRRPLPAETELVREDDNRFRTAAFKQIRRQEQYNREQWHQEFRHQQQEEMWLRKCNDGTRSSRSKARKLLCQRQVLQLRGVGP